jgi:hypothetical protein
VRGMEIILRDSDEELRGRVVWDLGAVCPVPGARSVVGKRVREMGR